MAKKGTGLLILGDAGTNINSELEKAGKEVIVKYGYTQVYVTSDRQAFPFETDARNHAATLVSKIIVKVTK